MTPSESRPAPAHHDRAALGVVLLLLLIGLEMQPSRLLAMHKAGVFMTLRAFVLGMLLSGSRYRLQVQATLEPYKGVLVSLFFVAVGHQS